MNGTRTSLFTCLTAVIFGLAVGSESAFAEPPPVIPIQGILSDSLGAPIDESVSIVFTIYSGAAPLFTEQSTVNVERGSFTHYLGSVSPLQMSLFQNHTDLSLGIKVGSDSELSPRIELGSVPYAAMATNASNAMTLDGHSPDDFMAASTFLSGLSQSSIEGIARGVCYDTPDQLHAVLDERYYRNVTELRAALDSVYVNNGATNSITTAMIQNGAVNRSKLHGTTQIFRITSSHCDAPSGTLWAFGTCMANQNNADSCPQCSVSLTKARDCSGGCTCVTSSLTGDGTMRPNYPSCTNASAGFAVNP